MEEGTEQEAKNKSFLSSYDKSYGDTIGPRFAEYVQGFDRG